MQTRALALASFAVMAFVLGIASCKSFDQGFEAGKCQTSSKDQTTCQSCCQAALPDGKGGTFTDKCHCIMANGQKL